MVCRWEGGGRAKWGGVRVQPMGEMGKYFCPSVFFQPFLENIDRRSCKDDGSHLGVPRRDALLGQVEREEGKTSSDQYPKGS